MGYSICTKHVRLTFIASVMKKKWHNERNGNWYSVNKKFRTHCIKLVVIRLSLKD